MKLPISFIILTFNEEKNIEACLKSIADIADEIFIVDSFSTDKTLEIASKYTDKIYKHAFKTHSLQWIWALNNLSVNNSWIMGLDADQSITGNLKNELIHWFAKNKTENIVGYYIPRKQIFMGRWIKYGGYYPFYLLKLFRKDCVKVESKELLDHHFYVTGKTLELKNSLVEDNVKERNISFWIDKHNKYATLQAIEELLHGFNKKGKLFGNKDERILWIKNRIWSKLPLFIRPLLYFIYRYLFKFGFLDGKEGLIFHFLQGFWYRFLVDAKIYEIEKKSKESGKDIKSVIEDIYNTKT